MEANPDVSPRRDPVCGKLSTAIRLWELASKPADAAGPRRAKKNADRIVGSGRDHVGGVPPVPVQAAWLNSSWRSTNRSAQEGQQK